MPEKTSYRPGEPDWVDLASPDLDASIAFYNALFGWDVSRGGEEVGGYSMFLKDGKNVAGLGPMFGEDQPPAWSSYISVEDADKAADLVTQNGGQVYAPPMDVLDAGRMGVFADPTGAAISVWQPKDMIGAGVIGEEGTFGWTELASRDPETAHRFYRAVFGWEPRISEGYTEYQLGGESVAGCMAMPDMVPAEVPSYWMPYFMASDPEAKAQQAAELGGTVVMPFMDMEQLSFAVVRDPHGATFGLLNLKQH